MVSDLERSRLTSVGIALLTSTLYREELTRIDARLSAERAFSHSELSQLAEEAGWRKGSHRRVFPAWQVLCKDPDGS